MEAKRYFDLDMAERIVRLVAEYGVRNEKIWGRKLQDRIRTSSNRTFNDCIFFLLRDDILATDSPRVVRRGQKVYFHLTETGTQILKYGIVRPFLEDIVLPNVPSKGKRRGKKARVDKDKDVLHQEQQQQNRWKAIHFFLNRGAFGVGYNIPDGLSPSGHVYYTTERREGVSIMDLVEKDDVCIEVNSYIRVSKPEAERIMQMPLAEGIMEEISQRDNNIAAVNRNGQKKSEDVRYGIKDKSLAEYILQWGCFQSAVLSRMLDLYDSIKGTMRGIYPIEREVRWLRDAIGPGRAERSLASASVRRGKTLVAYVSSSLQDINKLDDATQRLIHKRRKRYLRDEDVRIKGTFREIRANPELLKVEEKYPIITWIIKRSVYPEFLRESYRRRYRRKA